MNPAEIVSLSVGVVALLTAILGGLLWVIRAQVAMNREFRPNGGSSTRDSLNRIETDVREIRKGLQDHIDWHMDRR